jgi:hypothetical protein
MAQPQSSCVAWRVPFASASNFAHTTRGWMSGSRRGVSVTVRDTMQGQATKGVGDVELTEYMQRVNL